MNGGCFVLLKEKALHGDLQQTINLLLRKTETILLFLRNTIILSKGGMLMAGNTGKNHRDGAVKDRSQFQAPNGNWVKRDTTTGRFMDQKTTDGKFKGVRREK